MVRITEQGILNTFGKISDQSLRDRLISEITTTAVIHEIGHSLGITHHYNNTGSDEADKLFWTLGVTSCSMRYETSIEWEQITKFNFLRTHYCQKGETWARVDEDQPQGSDQSDINISEYPSHMCYWQINIKGE